MLKYFFVISSAQIDFLLDTYSQNDAEIKVLS